MEEAKASFPQSDWDRRRTDHAVQSMMAELEEARTGVRPEVPPPPVPGETDLRLAAEDPLYRVSAALVERYGNLLSQLLGNPASRGVRSSEWPAALLPAEPKGMEAFISTVADNPNTTPAQAERLGAMHLLLERFRPGRAVETRFVGALTARPVLLSFAYAGWLVWRGEGWLWIAAAVAFAIGWTVSLHSRFALARRKSFLLLQARTVGSMLALIGTASLWLRLVVGGGLLGGYGAVAGGLEPGGLGLAVVALAVGWFYSRQLGALYDFDRAPLRQTAGEEAP